MSDEALLPRNIPETSLVYMHSHYKKNGLPFYAFVFGLQDDRPEEHIVGKVTINKEAF